MRLFRAYHRDSYMVHRKERKQNLALSVTAAEKYQRRTISPASHSVPPSQGVAEHLETKGKQKSRQGRVEYLHRKKSAKAIYFAMLDHNKELKSIFSLA